MRTQHLALGALAAVLTAGVAHASPHRQLDQFISRTQAQARVAISACGADMGPQAMTVQGYIGSEGHLRSVQVIGSSGPRDGDRAIEAALKGLELEDVPPQLFGAKLTLVLGGGGQTADAR